MALSASASHTDQPSAADIAETRPSYLRERERGKKLYRPVTCWTSYDPEDSRRL